MKERKEDMRLTVKPLNRIEGVAPEFEEERLEEEDAHWSGGDTTGQIPSGPIASVEVENSGAFEDGQAICEAAGKSITNLKNAGTVLAWLLIQAAERAHESEWRWIYKVAFEAGKAATGHGGPGKAASFPMRRGRTEGVF